MNSRLGVTATVHSLGQDLTYGEARFILTEAVRSPALGGSAL
jgi:hypothetical protein